MCIDYDHEKLEKLGKNHHTCIVCHRNRDDIKVDKHHVCKEYRKGTDGMPRRLPTVTLDNGNTYFIDERLKQLRNIKNPHDYIDF